MKTRLIRPTFLGVSAMLIATCGYAGAQVSSQNMQSNMRPESTQTMRQSTPENVQLVSADAKLTHKIDSQSARQGQMVKAKLTSDVKTANGMKWDEGTILIGKVAKVEPSNNDGPSRLSIVFDEARLKDGKTIPVKATLLGAYPSNAGDYYSGIGSNNYMVGQPHRISSQQKVEQMPGTLSHVGMNSAVQSKVSATFIRKDGNIDLRKGTRLQVAIAPLTGANGTES